MQALPLVTILVGRKTDGGTCRVETLTKDADEPTYTEFPATGLSPGTPKWANYVKGVVDKFPGMYVTPAQSRSERPESWCSKVGQGGRG